MRSFFIIILSLSCCFLVSCRAKLDTSSDYSRRQTDVIGLELRKLDSLWSSTSERQTLRIEFYEPQYLDCFVPRNDAKRKNEIPEVLGDPEAAPVWPLTAAQSHQGGSLLPAGGGMGAALRQAQGPIKSIEITTENKEEVSAINATDSTYNNITAAEEDRESHVVSEARQDNGTVATVCIVFAVAALVYLMIRTFLKS